MDALDHCVFALCSGFSSSLTVATHADMFFVPVYNLGYCLPSRGRTICETPGNDKKGTGHEGIHTPQLQEEGTGGVIIWETAALVQGAQLVSVSWFIRRHFQLLTLYNVEFSKQ
jgi:hypothetical protein